MLRALIPSVCFNLRHLPFSQAVKLPIIVCKPRLRDNSGSFIINGPVRFGMIRLGQFKVDLFPDNGIVIANRGTIVFNGKTYIGNDSVLTVGKRGKLEFGENFTATAGLKLACHYHVSFLRNVLVGWNTQIIDSSFHALTDVKSGGVIRNGYGPVKVGHDVWIASGCKLYKNASIPDYCVVGADTSLNKPVDCEPYSLITNKREMVVKTTGKYRNRDDDRIEFR